MSTHSQIAALLKATMGLDPATVGRNVLDHAIRCRMAAGQMHDESEYYMRLQSSPGELSELIEALVVPETWFFRDNGAFAALSSIVVREWLPAHPGRTLRILSAPCSTGEEPYSIVIALREAGVPASRFTVDGVDISERALASARRATYGRNSFRGSEPGFRERYFQRRQNGYELVDEVRARVNFRQGNLVGPDFLKGEEPYDVVFCRNVLIYFHGPTQERVIFGLERLLAKDGVLFVGPAEPFLLRQKGFVSTGHPHAFSYVRSTRAAPILPSNENDGRRKILRQNAKPRTGIVRRTRKVEPLAPTQPTERSTDLRAANSLADAGRLSEAAGLCQAHLREHGPSVAGYYLLGLIRDAMGLERQADQCYRKVIYLDPDHLEGLTHLALLAEKRGDTKEAHRLQNRAQRIQREAHR